MPEDAEIVPGNYIFELRKDGQLLYRFRGSVPNEAGAITLEDIHDSSGETVEPGRVRLFKGDELAGNLSSGEEAAGRRLETDGEGGFRFADAGAGDGDMEKSVYDTDNDGKVNAAETADAAPWSGITGKPATFPPDSHNHDDRYYTETEVNTALSGKSDANHSHAASAITSGTVAPDRLGTGTRDGTRFLRDDGTWAPSSGSGGGDVLYAQLAHITAPDVNGGTFTGVVGGVRTPKDRPLNTIVYNGSGLASESLFNLATFEFKLLGGERYRIEGWSQVVGMDLNQASVHAVDDSIRIVGSGENGNNAASVRTRSMLSGIIDLTSAGDTWFTIQHWGNAVVADFGWGSAAGYASTPPMDNCYAFIEITKLA